MAAEETTWSPAERIVDLAVATGLGTGEAIHLWNLRTNQLVETLMAPAGYTIRKVAISSDGQIIAGGAYDPTGPGVLLWNAVGTGTAAPPPTVTQPPVTQRPSSTEGMVLIPAGEFEMGSNDEAPPVHIVYVDAFYMDKYEVTNAEYKNFVDANPEWQKSRIPRSLHGGNYLKHWDNSNNYPAGKADHPVVYVPWYAAMAYAEWAEKRLPTEAEWEKAARGGLKGMKYPWGNTISWTDANYGLSVGEDTTEVGSYPANGYGLYDMIGNVWEWCLDEYKWNFYLSSPSRNPLSGANTIANLNLIVDDYTNIKPESERVIRGTAFNMSGEGATVYRREGHLIKWEGWNLGFRCVKSVSP